MQIPNPMENDWLWKLLPIIVPLTGNILIAIVAGLWFNSRNERLKSELQSAAYKTQLKVEDIKLHLNKIEELYELLISLAGNLDRDLNEKYPRIASETPTNTVKPFLFPPAKISMLVYFYAPSLTEDLNKLESLGEELLDSHLESNKALRNKENSNDDRHWAITKNASKIYYIDKQAILMANKIVQIARVLRNLMTEPSAAANGNLLMIEVTKDDLTKVEPINVNNFIDRITKHPRKDYSVEDDI